jgi:pimeloyl-ACP methyl ester carboxylesterase
VFAHSSTATALALVAALVTVSAGAARPFDPSPYLHAQRLVDIGGRRINLYCTGRGSPTVLLDADGDDGTPAWRLVQPIVAKHARVCSYDSAGIGFSDSTTTRRDASAAVTDLHDLMTRAGIGSPLVLVGYSLSGLYARLYADRYPKDVVGLVLVSANIPNQGERIARIAPVLGPAFAQNQKYVERCLQAAERGAIRPATPFADCIYVPPDPTMPKSLKTLIERQSERPGWWRAFTSGTSNERASSSEVLREQRDYGNMPLVVLTTDKDILSLPIPKGQKTRLARAWLKWHDEIARLSRHGVNILVKGSTSSIPIDRPDIVTAAIGEVLDQVRCNERGRERAGKRAQAVRCAVEEKISASSPFRSRSCSAPTATACTTYASHASSAARCAPSRSSAAITSSACASWS